MSIVENNGNKRGVRHVIPTERKFQIGFHIKGNLQRFIEQKMTYNQVEEEIQKQFDITHRIDQGVLKQLYANMGIPKDQWPQRNPRIDSLPEGAKKEHTRWYNRQYRSKVKYLVQHNRRLERLILQLYKQVGEELPQFWTNPEQPENDTLSLL